MRRRWVGIITLAAIAMLLLPMPIAERYTSPTQDGQYLSNPSNAYRFVFAAARVSTSSELNTSGEALDSAKDVFGDSDYLPTKVELLFLPARSSYTYTTRTGEAVTAKDTGEFVWEVWGVPREAGAGDDKVQDTEEADVIGLLDYVTGTLLGERP